jgi:hypothetical protein
MDFGEHVNPEYVIRQYSISLKIPPVDQKKMVSTIKMNFVDALKKSGAEINGLGISGWQRTVSYTGVRTVGEFRLFAMPLGESNLKVILIQFECRR